MVAITSVVRLASSCDYSAASEKLCRNAQKTGGRTINNALRTGRNFLRFNSSSGVAEDFDCLV